MARAIVSTALPAPKGTTSLIGRSGKPCDQTADEKVADAAIAAAMPSQFLR
jgi:hypothetical protein